MKPEQSVMPFGKYEGYALEELPDDYFDWLAKLDNLRPPLKQKIAAEAERRERVRDAERTARLATPLVINTAEEIIKQGVRVLLRSCHPDAGGTPDAMAAVNNAADLLRGFLRWHRYSS